jgi:CRISPR-associated protein (TIGR02584 family)
MPQQIYFPTGHLTHCNKKRLLLEAMGLMSTVITETILALARLTSPFYPTALHIIISLKSLSHVRLLLLGEHPTWLARLKQDYSLPSINFEGNHIYVLSSK